MMTLSLDQISEQQLTEMRHALGLQYKKRPYRNYFNCDSNDKNWNDLVAKGFATKRPSWGEDAYYSLTYEAVKLIYGKPISKKYYNGL